MKQRRIKIQLEFHQEIAKLHRPLPLHFAFDFRNLLCHESGEPAGRITTRPAPAWHDNVYPLCVAIVIHVLVVGPARGGL